MYRVYLLRCSDNSLYCGVSTDINRRLIQHGNGTGSKYVRSRLPVELVWSSEKMSKSDALKEECRIKKCSKEEKEGSLIDNIN